jgi:hypothetical protein
MQILVGCEPWWPFEVKLLCEYESVCQKTLTRLQGPRWKYLMEKTWGRKSGGTVLLKIFDTHAKICICAQHKYICSMHEKNIMLWRIKMKMRRYLLYLFYICFITYLFLACTCKTFNKSVPFQPLSTSLLHLVTSDVSLCEHHATFSAYSMDAALRIFAAANILLAPVMHIFPPTAAPTFSSSPFVL